MSSIDIGSLVGLKHQQQRLAEAEKQRFGDQQSISEIYPVPGSDETRGLTVTVPIDLGILGDELTKLVLSQDRHT